MRGSVCRLVGNARVENLEKKQKSLEMIQNKAGYTAAPFGCGWAGAIFELTRAFEQEQYGQRMKNMKKDKVWPTDQPTNQQTKRGEESRSTQLKTRIYDAAVVVCVYVCLFHKNISLVKAFPKTAVKSNHCIGGSNKSVQFNTSNQQHLRHDVYSKSSAMRQKPGTSVVT